MNNYEYIKNFDIIFRAYLRTMERIRQMNNYEYIKNMSIEEMASAFADHFNCSLCSEGQRLADNPLLKDEKCDGNCALYCKEWLENEVDE